MEAAVVSVSHGALGSLLGKLGELLTAKYKLLKEAKGHIIFLKAELESMHAFMKKISDADEEPDEQDKCWAKEVRELSYDIEDSVKSELITAVKKFLLDKRYLIVIDDIWDPSAWDIIRCALPENKNGSRVITTTRNEAVARACCTNHIECVYKMKALSDLDSRSLFFKRIFDSEETCPPYLDEVSAEILKKCGGLPLAIITISSVLANQPNKLKKEQWDCVRDSLGSNFEMSPSLEGMRQILNLSYTSLPHYLKSCMLYLGIYPEDYEIDRNDLTRQWVAEGFICKARGRDAEDIAKSYFNELINRSMIQATDTDYSGEVNFCRVHDMMLDLILHKCREENFITVVDDIQDMTGHQDKIRRLSFNLDGAINNTAARSVQLSQTRTLAKYGPSWHWLPLKLFKHLRVLVFEFSGCYQSEQLLDITGICHLFQLVFLKIEARGYRLVLPGRIGDLQHLEVFHINAEIFSSKGTQSHKLPSDIVTLSRLLHLRVPWGWGVILPEGIGSMKSLRSLYGFDLGNSLDNIKALRELTNLTDLTIFKSHNYTSDERSREVLHALENLCNLKHLRFHAHNDASMDEWSSVPVSFIYLHTLVVYFLFFGVPEWIGQLHSLYDLTHFSGGVGG
ncbi:hypothetical protein HU200_008879 [Digitaria exilis]|uniref:Uncharacterized protein n=1 Tax=Digitaria exilis TaxID=1010633 RepID=A0A835FKX8_9POAL|nr:hypothetical protein HU200_008879 [Digitaria exilis]